MICIAMTGSCRTVLQKPLLIERKMKKENSIILFNQKKVRRHWDDNKEQWYFSIVDVVAILTESINPQPYWRKLKERLKKEGNETVTSCHALKMQAADGKMRFTDVADTEQLRGTCGTF